MFKKGGIHDLTLKNIHKCRDCILLIGYWTRPLGDSRRKLGKELAGLQDSIRWGASHFLALGWIEKLEDYELPEEVQGRLERVQAALTKLKRAEDNS